MKILKLEWEAFGPFINKNTIDFQMFDQSSLFLIQGETGAGKTFILDAITYALYGKSSSGKRGDFDEMRCRMADDTKETYVQVDISIQQKIYRFKRFLRKKKKKDKTIEYVVECDGGEIVNNQFFPFFEHCKLRALEEKAIALIGLTHLQFIQVIVLPQGMFEQLLVSKSEEKQEILTTLFQTQKWKFWCEQLNESLKKQRLHLTDMQNKMELYINQSEFKQMQDFKENLQKMNVEYQQLKVQLHKQKDIFMMHQSNYQKQKQLDELYQQNKLYKQQFNEMLKQKSQIEDLKTKQKEQEHLQHFKHYFELYDTYKKQQKQLELKNIKLKKELESVLKQKDVLQQKVSEYESISLQQQQLRLQTLQNELLQRQEYETLQKQIEEIDRPLLKLEKQMQIYESKISTITKEIDVIKANEKVYEHKLSQLPNLIEELQNYEQAKILYLQNLHHKKQLYNMKNRFKQLKQEKIEIEEIILVQRSKVEKQKENFIQYSAALLATLLEDNKPCPVCGSLHHNTIEQAKTNQFFYEEYEHTQKQLEQYQQQCQQINVLLQELKQQKLEQKNHINLIENQIFEILQGKPYDEKDHQEILNQYNMLLEEKKEWEKESHLCKEYQENVLKWKIQWEENRKQKLHFQTMYETLKQEELKFDRSKDSISSIALKEKIQAFQIQMQKEQEEKMLANQKLQSCLILSNKLEYENTKCEQQLQEIQIQMQEIYVLLQNEFPQYSEKEEIQFEFIDQKIYQQIEVYERKYVELDARIQELTKQLHSFDSADLEKLKKIYEESEIEYNRQLQMVTTLKQEIKQKNILYEQIQNIQEEYTIQFQNYAKKSEFVKAMRGDGGIGIERYVLGIMLCSITQSANQLLKSVHQGRYQIYRSDTSQGRNRKFGLDLVVYDAYSCSKRSVHSLSGGEKFLVSLALSIGLSTIVQAQSGGMKIETLFIDEGFGSLDEQSIQEALQMLSNVASNQTMIGLISHIEYLKFKIMNGIHVHKQKEGSFIEMII